MFWFQAGTEKVDNCCCATRDGQTSGSMSSVNLQEAQTLFVVLLLYTASIVVEYRSKTEC